jgi:hypothetical protein
MVTIQAQPNQGWLLMMMSPPSHTLSGNYSWASFTLLLDDNDAFTTLRLDSSYNRLLMYLDMAAEHVRARRVSKGLRFLGAAWALLLCAMPQPMALAWRCHPASVRI